MNIFTYTNGQYNTFEGTFEDLDELFANAPKGAHFDTMIVSPDLNKDVTALEGFLTKQDPNGNVATLYHAGLPHPINEDQPLYHYVIERDLPPNTLGLVDTNAATLPEIMDNYEN